MTRHDEDAVEREVGRALSALPAPRAPRTLLPRVLTATVHAPEASMPVPMRQGWSPFAQAALAAVTLVLIAGVYGLWMFPELIATLLPAPVQDAGRRADQAASTASDLLRVGALVWQAVVAPIVKGLFAITLTLCAACALFAAALGRLALGGAHPHDSHSL